MTPDATGTELRLRTLLAGGSLDLPAPGLGRTGERFGALARLAATEDLSVARLAEAHCDAAAIVNEAGRALPPGMVAGVWASRYGGSAVDARRSGNGWELSGELRFCSGAPLLDAALVDAQVEAAAMRLFLVPLREGGITIDDTVWRTPALAATATSRVTLDVELSVDAAIGPAGFYLARPGFWHGAIGVAACWAGGAEGVRRFADGRVSRDDPYAVAEVGRAASASWAMTAALDTAAREIDDDPQGVDAARALIVRHLVASGCREVIEATQRATGPGPLAFDGAHAQRIADLRLYIEQQHHDHDLAEIGRARLAGLPCRDR